MQLCVTGANGFIGKHLVSYLYHLGHTLRVLTRRSDTSFSGGIQVVRGDLTSMDCPLDEFLDGCDVLFHCAGEIHYLNAMHLLHVEGTQRLIHSALKGPARVGQQMHWVQLSSVGAYGPPQGPANSPRIVTEDTPTRPVGDYEMTKTRADELVIQACHGGAMTCTILRPSNVIGATMTNQSLHKLIQMIRRGLFFHIGKPGAIATYVHVNDVVAALVKCAFDPSAKGQIYNLSSDCSLEELVAEIASALGVRPPWGRCPEMLIRTLVDLIEGKVSLPLSRSRIDAVVSRTRYPANKISSELGFRFSKPLPAAIEELVSSCK